MTDLIQVTIDGVMVEVPAGSMVIRAAEAAGAAVPRFCDHPLLEPVGACRQCLVEIPDTGQGRGLPKPAPACTTAVAPGMVVATQATSNAAAAAQADILELLLINHPLDCPICDKGGECPLQNQALADGRGESRYEGVKRQYPKPVAVSPLILLDRERCVLCTRCTRFSDQIAGDGSIEVVERGAQGHIATAPGAPYQSYFSGNVIQICPVGALTSADYRFSARPFDLTSTVTTCDNCAAGCQLRVDARHGQVRRRYAGNCPEVNEEWSCDKGRFGFVSARGADRLTRPLVRRDGELVAVSWPEAIAAAVEGLRAAGDSVGVVTGGRLTTQVAYAYSAFARQVLRTNSIDYRARPASDEEAEFLAAHVAGAGQPVTYADFDTASRIVLVGFEPEDESPNVFLRLRRAHRHHQVPITTIASHLSPGARKLDADLIAIRPDAVAQAITDLELNDNTIILAGERLARMPGALTALDARLRQGQARLGWIPRRAGELSALAAGCLPGLLPGGRPFDNLAARSQVARLWGEMPVKPGWSAAAMMERLADGRLAAVVTAGIEAGDFADPVQVRAGLQRGFVVALEARASDVVELADVVLPVELGVLTGSFLNWEQRVCPVRPVTTAQRATLDEITVLVALADALGTPLGVRSTEQADQQLARLPVWTGPRASLTPVSPPSAPDGAVVVATWRELLDDARCLDGATQLLASARTPVAKLSPATVRAEGLATSSFVRLTGPAGSATFPIQVEPTMVDGVVWVPSRARGNPLTDLGASPGQAVTLAAAPAPGKEGER